jgi:hypothetical protein
MNSLQRPSACPKTQYRSRWGRGSHARVVLTLKRMRSRPSYSLRGDLAKNNDGDEGAIDDRLPRMLRGTLSRKITELNNSNRSMPPPGDSSQLSTSLRTLEITESPRVTTRSRLRRPPRMLHDPKFYSWLKASTTLRHTGGRRPCCRHIWLEVSHQPSSTALTEVNRIGEQVEKDATLACEARALERAAGALRANVTDVGLWLGRAAESHKIEPIARVSNRLAVALTCSEPDRMWPGHWSPSACGR